MGMALFAFALYLVVFSVVRANEPPRLQLEAYQSQVITGVGLDVKLACPVKSKSGNLLVEWSKDGEVMHSDFFRIKVVGNVLRIKDVRKDDGGRYLCTGVNGFGSENVFLDLIVLDEGDSRRVNLAFLPSTVSQPKFITRNVGDSVKLPCEATGIPVPRTYWEKDDAMLPKTDISRDGMTSLLFGRLAVEDTGTYVCVAQNIHGSINTSYHLQVLDAASSGRILQNAAVDNVYFLNTTVQRGTIATLQCRVTSDVTPHIEWLKRVEAHDRFLYTNQTISVGAEEFRVLKSDDIVRKEDGSYVNRLTILQVQDGDAGLYVCLGANTMGYSFKEAYLIVIPGENQPNSIPAENTGTFIISIIIPLSVFVFLFATATIWMRCHARTRKPILPTDLPPPLLEHKYETVTQNPRPSHQESLLAKNARKVPRVPEPLPYCAARVTERQRHMPASRVACTCYMDGLMTGEPVHKKAYSGPEYV